MILPQHPIYNKPRRRGQRPFLRLFRRFAAEKGRSHAFSPPPPNPVMKKTPSIQKDRQGRTICRSGGWDTALQTAVSWKLCRPLFIVGLLALPWEGHFFVRSRGISHPPGRTPGPGRLCGSLPPALCRMERRPSAQPLPFLPPRWPRRPAGNQSFPPPLQGSGERPAQ